MHESLDRRRFLDRRRLLAGAAVLVAGCGTGGPADDGAPADGESPADDGSPVDGGTTASPGDRTGTATDGPGGSSSPTESGGDPTTSASPEAEGTSTTADATGTPTGGELDLREANVTAVSVAEEGGGYRFDVTLYHDDDGEDGYANWWQVETRDGERLGRRELLHAHGTREFTRSDSFELPAVDCVVVRGHDQTHGYGGQAMLVTLATGATRAVRQGPEPRSPADAECP